MACRGKLFLPGAREIRACADSCAGLAAPLGLELVSLHGQLPAAAQDHAVDARGGPKLILSTNVAETSVTIAGIAAMGGRLYAGLAMFALIHLAMLVGISLYAYVSGKIDGLSRHHLVAALRVQYLGLRA